jgi:hypothetical protein
VALVEVGSLTKDVDHNHDRIEPMGLQKLDNEVHRDGVPALIWNLGRMKLTMGEPPEHLRPVAHITGSEILADVSGQLGPLVVPGDELQRLEVTSMSGDPRVMVLLHNLATEVLIPRHDNLAMKQDESVRDLPFGRAGGWGLPVLEELLGNKCDGVLKLQLSCEHLPDVTQEGNLRSVDCDSLCYLDLEELWPKEHNVRVLGNGSVVGAAREHVWTTHEMA